ncbi:hypothetical protein VNO80_25445 [Phaseolus coccineus]|uniref:Uncharacterized protein n=1 Tax=Phaseolus coccineus TaxID=3886 RepID=A0AAN9LU96_PHACN
MAPLARWVSPKIGGKWVSKDDNQDGSSSGAHVQDEGEKQVDVVAASDDTGVADAYDVGVVGAYDAGPSDGNMGERITSMSPFERCFQIQTEDHKQIRDFSSSNKGRLLNIGYNGDGIDTGCGTYDSRLLDDECGVDEKGNGMIDDDCGT